MERITNRIFSNVAMPDDWHTYLLSERKPYAILTSVSTLSKQCHSKRLTLLAAYLTALHRCKDKRYQHCNFYIHVL